MHPAPSRTLRLIAAFKLAKGLILVILGLGLLRLLHQDIGAITERWLEQFRIDPDNKYAAAILAKAGLLNGKSIPVLSGLTFAYAGIFWTEGIGLFLRKRWAEWLTVVTTSSFVPLEIRELCHHFSAVKVILLAINLAIVAFLIWRLKQPHRPF